MNYTRKTFKRGEIITREGDVDLVMYEIVIGSVGIFKNYGTEDEQFIAGLRDGDFIGEMEMVSVRARTATVVAMDRTEVVVITRDDFEDFIRNHPEKVITIMQQMSDRMRKTTEAYAELSAGLQDVHDKYRFWKKIFG